MTISSLNGTAATTASTSATSSASSASSSSANVANQNTFLKLLVAQMSNQDPLSPSDSTQWVTQLAQFSSVEQAVNQTTALTNVSNQIASLSNNDATSFVGKTVTIGNQPMAFNGMLATQSSVTLNGAAQTVTATVLDSKGNAVRTLNLGAKNAGALAVTWDGKTDSGATAATGNYSLSVSALSAAGAPVSVAQNVTGVVSSVNFSNGTAQVVLNNGTTAALSAITNVAATSTSTTTP